MARKDETDLARYDWTRARRGQYLNRARRSVALVPVPRAIYEAFGSDEAVTEVLRRLIEIAPKPRAAKARRPRVAQRTIKRAG